MQPGPPLPNGEGAAAILAAGVGCFTLGCFALASDAVPAVQRAFVIWEPSGALSGVTTAAIAVWLVAWFLLSRQWRRRDLPLGWIIGPSFTMLLAGLLLTFPPVMDWLQGR